MRELFVLLAHLLTTLVKLCRPGGLYTVAAESLRSPSSGRLASTMARYPAFATDSARASSETFASATTAAVPSLQSPTSALSMPGTKGLGHVPGAALTGHPLDTQRKMDSIAHGTPP